MIDRSDTSSPPVAVQKKHSVHKARTENGAVMIPEFLPARANSGEARVFSLLKRLPSDCIVYYEPVISGRYPDFVVIMPEVGMLTIEVKGWRAGDVTQIDSDNVICGGTAYRHPLRQVRDYMLSLMDECLKSPFCKTIKHTDGPHAGHLKFPVDHLVIFTTASRKQMENAAVGNLLNFFPSDKTLFSDRLSELEKSDIGGGELVEVLKGFFAPNLRFKPENGGLDQRQIDELRLIIHPEIEIKGSESVSAKESCSLKVLDLEQEKNARKIGAGHRLLWGVAGSGKTVILVARARLLLMNNPDARLLITCYNKTLSTWLRNNFKDEENAHITVLNFHQLAVDTWSVRPVRDDTNQTFGERILKRISVSGLRGTYDAILVDEAQDFDPTWFQALLTLMRDPENGDLLIVGDGTQGIYKSRRITWKSLGINAQGRTSYLRRNYRNTREIVRVAALYAPNTQEAEVTDDESYVEAVRMNPENATRPGVLKPILLKCDRRNNVSATATVIKDLLEGRLNGHGLPEKLQPEQIAVLYQARTGNMYMFASSLENALNRHNILAVNVTRDTRTFVTGPGVKIMTIYSAKGLQFKAVIFAGAEHMHKNLTEDEKLRLAFVAMTRAEDYLIILDNGGETTVMDPLRVNPELVEEMEAEASDE